LGAIVETESRENTTIRARNMSSRRVPGSPLPTGAAAGAEPSVAALFTLIWDALADVLGTAATATLLRRAARRAAPRCAELTELAVVREKLEYRYTLPSAWADGAGGTPLALRELVAELRPLLVELTGPVVVRRLERIPELWERGVISPQEEQP
jgi:hypothetical protein